MCQLKTKDKNNYVFECVIDEHTIRIVPKYIYYTAQHYKYEYDATSKKSTTGVIRRILKLKQKSIYISNWIDGLIDTNANIKV